MPTTNGQGQAPGLVIGPYQGLGIREGAAVQTHAVLPDLVVVDVLVT